MTWKTRCFTLIALLTVCWIARVCGSITAVPKITVAKLGDKVEFECSTVDGSSVLKDAADETIPPDWIFFAVNSSEGAIIYRSGVVTHNLISKYGINNTTPGQYNLIMNFVDLSFAGNYSCSEALTEDKEHHSISAELIVIASDPMCSTNASTQILEGDYIAMRCTVNYSGNRILEMEWIRNYSEKLYTEIQCSNTSTTVASMLIKQVNSNDNGATFTCKTILKLMTTDGRSMQKSEANATNFTYYLHMWNYTANVYAASRSPENDRVKAIGIGLCVGAVLVCVVISWIIYKLRKREKEKPDVVPQDRADNFDDCEELPQSQHSHPLCADGQKKSNGFHVVENHLLFPVYALVNKDRIIGDKNETSVVSNHQERQNIPIYAEVMKIEKEQKKIAGSSSLTPSTTDTKPKQNCIGADGTQYEEMNPLAELKSNGACTKQPAMFSLVETYASIDHTMRAPPPPPPPPHTPFRH